MATIYNCGGKCDNTEPHETDQEEDVFFEALKEHTSKLDKFADKRGAVFAAGLAVPAGLAVIDFSHKVNQASVNYANAHQKDIEANNLGTMGAFAGMGGEIAGGMLVAVGSYVLIRKFKHGYGKLKGSEFGQGVQQKMSKFASFVAANAEKLKDKALKTDEHDILHKGKYHHSFTPCKVDENGNTIEQGTTYVDKWKKAMNIFRRGYGR